jgi:cytochrome c peroxidase
MRKWFIIGLLSVGALIFISFIEPEKEISAARLRKWYSKPAHQWPVPTVDAGINWQELGLLPESPLEKHKDSLKHLVELGKMLFFDTRLSGSGKISCASCHLPEMNWTDGKEKSVGHEGAVTKRNSPTIQNTWYYNRLFWDGRAKDLQDQAFGPINSETEMHNEMPDVMRMLRRSSQYRQLFKQAYGYDDIGPDELTNAIACFEKTITSGKSRFDAFLEGNKKALSDSELRGLHLFRTKARCMNCHNGPLFSDNQFHNNGLSDDGDAGYYQITHKEEDKGKFKTPSLRDVMMTGPWLHSGKEKYMMDIIELYRKGPAGADKLIRPLGLTGKEKADLLAFLNAISAPPAAFKKPVLPE